MGKNIKHSISLSRELRELGYKRFRGYIDLCEIKWSKLIEKPKKRSRIPSSFNLNSETVDLNFENFDPIVLSKKDWDYQPLWKIYQEVIHDYNDTHYIPGFEYQRWISENPDKMPRILKNGDWYLMPGSLLCESNCSISVPCGKWFDKKWVKLSFDIKWWWDPSKKIILLPRERSLLV